MKEKNPLVSVIIPVREINYHIIFENLPALNKQTYQNYEAIVLPNEHTHYDLTLLKQYQWLRIIPTGKITRPAEKRDIGTKEAKGEIVAFIDDDAFPTPHWLKTATDLLKKNNITAVCGPGVLPPQSNQWEKVFDEVLKTKFGSGGYEYRFVPKKARYVDDYPSMNFLIQKKLFQKLGGFNSDYWPGEDSKLCNDLVYGEKQKILYHPDVIIYHHRRKDLIGYLKQHANYGFHRGAFFAHGDQNSRRFAYLMPTLFVWYLFAALITIALIFMLRWNIVLLLIAVSPLLIYMGGMLFIFLSALINAKNLFIAIVSPLTLFLTHILYGILFMKGFMKGIQKHSSIYD